MNPNKNRVHRMLEAGIVSLLLSLIFSRAAAAQSFDRLIDGVPIERNGALIEFPFWGGLDRFIPQFVDIDGDGDFDLFFSEADGRLTFLENIGTPQAHRFRFITDHYERLEVNGWFYFVDADADGDFDLYHANGNGGLVFRRNIGSPSRAQFALVTHELMDSEGATVFSEITSIPTFADIDADDDVDFFTGLSLGTIVFYRNVGSPQMPLFKFETDRWQNLLIFSFGKASRSSQPKILPQQTAHGANGITFADLDADGDKDFFYGDLFHNSVYHLQNDGTPQEPEVTAITDTLFPPSQPLITLGFNIPRFTDLDADGDLDFLAACLNQDRNHFIFFQNAGNAAAPKLNLVTNNFLSMVDEGSNSAPALADIDSDGDQDLLIGTLDGQLIFYDNIGTASAPAFRWLTDAFQNIQLVEFAITPSLVDIDGDGDFDLFVGSFLGKLAFVENRGDAKHPNFILVTK
ncbi:MAG: VCBS repeat-containing protein, partial [candidate division KSB1 bacterium]|nr:VCBS repeat-containing protein [candidate division KSB1 bacterium]